MKDLKNYILSIITFLLFTGCSVNKTTTNQIAKKDNPNAFFLFDDIYQHRKVITNFSIITTPFNDLFVDDMVLPVGRLREPKGNINRASCILVTRCPEPLSQEERTVIEDKLSRYKKPLFFCSSLTMLEEIKYFFEWWPHMAFSLFQFSS